MAAAEAGRARTTRRAILCAVSDSTRTQVALQWEWKVRGRQCVAGQGLNKRYMTDLIHLQVWRRILVHDIPLWVCG